jgi:hypothetical protein
MNLLRRPFAKKKGKNMNKKYRIMVGALLLAACQSWASLVGLWEFDAGNETGATIGSDLGTTGTYSSMVGKNAGDGAVSIGPGSFFTATHGIAANGGGNYVNEWSLLIDFKYPTLEWISFFQTNTSNSNDGDCFVRGGGGVAGSLGIGATGYGSAATSTETWYRMIVSVDNGTHYKIYLDGVEHLDGTAQSVDGTFSLDPTLLLFADNNLEDGEIHVTSAAMWDAPLTTGEMTALGTVGTAIPEPATLGLFAMFGGTILFIRRRLLVR